MKRSKSTTTKLNSREIADIIDKEGECLDIVRIPYRGEQYRIYKAFGVKWKIVGFLNKNPRIYQFSKSTGELISWD